MKDWVPVHIDKTDYRLWLSKHIQRTDCNVVYSWICKQILDIHLSIFLLLCHQINYVDETDYNWKQLGRGKWNF